MKRILVSFAIFAIASASMAQSTSVLSLFPKEDTRLAVNITYIGKDLSVWSGPVKARFNDVEFDAYCVDLEHWNSPTTSYEVRPSPITNLTFGSRAAYLYNKLATGVDNKTKGAALQLAIWDVVTDNGDGFGAGDFKAKGLSDEVKTLAQSYLSDSAGKHDVAVLFEAVNHGSDGKRNQDMMGPVPEPATMAALGIGLAAILRRRKQK